MKLLLVASMLAIASSSSFAGGAISPSEPIAACSDQLPYGVPTSVKTHTQIVCRPSEYVLEYSIPMKSAIWVQYVLTPEHTTGCAPRAAHFKPDPSLPDESSAHAKDYAKSGWDIGHLANDDDFRWSEQGEIDTNDFANADPQAPGLNRVGWKMLEDNTRAWASEREHNLVVTVGPVLNPLLGTLGADQLPIPSAFWKVEMDMTTLEVQSFLYPNAATDEEASSFLTSFAAVQQAAGIQIPLPATAKFSTNVWPLMHKSVRSAKAKVCALH
jgi:endonuclease G